jgi:hypothetical protein
MLTLAELESLELDCTGTVNFIIHLLMSSGRLSLSSFEWSPKLNGNLLSLPVFLNTAKIYKMAYQDRFTF